MSTNPQHKYRLIMRKSFTLIELLVVIAIIGILASLLLPALSEARKSSYKTVCISNLKQIKYAADNYIIDNNDWFFQYSQTTDYVTFPSNQANAIWHSNPGKPYGAGILIHNGYLGGTGGLRIFYCPSNTYTDSYWDHGPGIAASNWGKNADVRADYSIDNVLPGQYYLTCKGKTNKGWNIRNWCPCLPFLGDTWCTENSWYQPHSMKGWNVVYNDGSAKYLTLKEINPNWWDDGTFQKGGGLTVEVWRNAHSRHGAK